MLDTLVLNAGDNVFESKQTSDGFEHHIGINHVGHQLLTSLLLPALLRTHERRRGGSAARVVCVASAAAWLVTERPLWPSALARKAIGADEWRGRYALSKLANALFAKELQRQHGDKLFACAAAPGAVFTGANTVIVRGSFFVRNFMRAYMSIAARTPAQGAATVEFCALADGAQAGAVHADARASSVLTPLLHDADLARELFVATQQAIQ